MAPTYEEVATAIGYVVLTSGVLELNMSEIGTFIDRTTKHRHVMGSTQAICRVLKRSVEALTEADPELGARAEAYRVEAEACLAERHRIVHAPVLTDQRTQEPTRLHFRTGERAAFSVEEAMHIVARADACHEEGRTLLKEVTSKFRGGLIT